MATFHPLPDDLLVRRIAPRTGRVDMVLDTDVSNEIDDQFAMMYALLSPEAVNVEAIYSVPWSYDRPDGTYFPPDEGVHVSYDSAVHLLKVSGLYRENFVFMGSERYMEATEDIVDSPAARDLVARAMARPDDDPLYVCAIGGLTNVASALLMQPEIIKKIVIVWLGGNALHWPETHEHNLFLDLHATRVVLDCGAPLVLAPCTGVSSHLLTTYYELEGCLGGKNRLCDDLVRQFDECIGHNRFACALPLQDIAAVAWLVNPEYTESEIVPCPRVSDDFRWSRDGDRHLIRVLRFVKRNPIYADLFRKLIDWKE